MRENKRIKRFTQERDAVLLTGDVHACTAFMLRHNPGLPPPSSFAVAEMMMHKAITAASSLPMDYRVRSYRWLTERKLKSLDDGDVRDAAERE